MCRSASGKKRKDHITKLIILIAVIDEMILVRIVTCKCNLFFSVLVYEIFCNFTSDTLDEL